MGFPDWATVPKAETVARPALNLPMESKYENKFLRRALIEEIGDISQGRETSIKEPRLSGVLFPAGRRNTQLPVYWPVFMTFPVLTP